MALMKQYHPNCAERCLIEVIKRIQGKAAVIPTMALRDIINDEKVALFKVPTADNVADAFTKCMDVKAIAARLKPQPQQIFSMEDAHREDVYEPADLDTDSNWSEGSEGALGGDGEGGAADSSDGEGLEGAAGEDAAEPPLVTAPTPEPRYNLRSADERRAPAWQKDYVMASILYA
jgi:hypothetical protein